MADDSKDQEKLIEQWKIRKLIKSLEAARGNGTSMISLILPPGDQISRCSKMLQDELGTASNIKSRVTRQSVLGAIKATIARLKLYNRVPPNGLVVYCGTITTLEGREKRVNIDFEPFKPVNTSLYLCDNKFHTEALNELLESDRKFGFIVVDGNGCLYGTLCGNTRTVLHKFSVDLPKKHARGGQSAVRFARLRMEKRHNYLHKVAELATQMYISQDRPNVHALVLAGAAAFKTDLNGSDLFDPRLSAIVIKIVDVSYGFENGFQQAIELSADALSNVQLVHEKKLLTQFFTEISTETGKYCFGITDLVQALTQGAVDTIIAWENLDLIRVTLRNQVTNETMIVNVTPEQDKKGDYVREHSQKANAALVADGKVNQDGTHAGSGKDIMEPIEKVPVLEWLAQEYKNFGARLEFVTDRSTEGTQFCKGFGGVGALLRYKVQFAADLEEGPFESVDDAETIV